ncbi:hypothetical protein GCM10020000_29940 [Streptomyces olivoverticillatus]
MDTVLRNATVIDGTGETPPYRADVGLAEGRIAAICREGRGGGKRPSGRRVIDAQGLALSPGFIDMHAHSDLALLADPAHEAKAAQGVTLEVLGQDGLSYAPVDDRTLDEVRTRITGWNGDGRDVAFDWRTVGEYLDRLDRGVAVNAAYLVPQGTVRMLAVGWEDRPATAAETGHMRRLVAEGLEQGGRRALLRAHLPARHVRRRRRTDRAVPGRGPLRRLLLPAPPLVRRGRDPGVRRGDRPRPRRGLRAAPGPRRHELPRERVPRPRAARPAGLGPRGGLRHHPRHLPLHPPAAPHSPRSYRAG